MRFVWSDDLAALLIEIDGIDPDRLAAWVSAPTGHRVELAEDPLEVARRLLTDAADRPGRAA